MQILWFATDDLMVMVGCYILALVMGGWTWGLLVLGPVTYIRAKRGKPRGYYKHKILGTGMISLARYPSAFVRTFHE